MRTTAEAAEMPTARVRRPRTFRKPLALWLTALLFLVAFAAFVVFTIFALKMLATGQRQDGIAALAAMGVFVGTRIIASLNARSLTCHLCHGPVLREKRCHKHPTAQSLPLLGYRSLVVLSAVFTGGFKCIYCGSDFRMGQKKSGED